MWNSSFQSIVIGVTWARPHCNLELHIPACLYNFFFSFLRLWNCSQDIRLHCNFYFIRNLQFHIFPNGITWIIYISGNNLSINHSDSQERAHKKDQDESKSCFIIRSSFFKILTFIFLKSEAVWETGLLCKVSFLIHEL